MSDKSIQNQEQSARERLGWLSLVAIAVAFPTLFFLCVWFPIWMGWTDVY